MEIMSSAWTNSRFPPPPEKNFSLACAPQMKFCVPSPASWRIIFLSNSKLQATQKSSQSPSGKMNRLSYRPSHVSRSTTRKSASIPAKSSSASASKPIWTPTPVSSSDFLLADPVAQPFPAVLRRPRRPDEATSMSDLAVFYAVNRTSQTLIELQFLFVVRPRRGPHLWLASSRNRPRSIFSNGAHRKKMIVGRNPLQHHLARVQRKLKNLPARFRRLAPQNFKARAFAVVFRFPRKFCVRSHGAGQPHFRRSRGRHR